MKTLVKSAGYAVVGLTEIWKQERNFKIQIAVGIIVCLTAFALEFSWMEWIFMIIAIAMVLAGELLNTVVEHLLDHMIPHKNESVRILKDMMAGMVLIQSIGAAAIGIIILLHHFAFLS